MSVETAIMETIFDHNPTEEELVTIFGSLARAEEDREWCKKTGKVNSIPIVLLYSGRGDNKMVEKYLAMIENPVLRFDVRYSLHQCA